MNNQLIEIVMNKANVSPLEAARLIELYDRGIIKEFGFELIEEDFSSRLETACGHVSSAYAGSPEMHFENKKFFLELIINLSEEVIIKIIEASKNFSHPYMLKVALQRLDNDWFNSEFNNGSPIRIVEESFFTKAQENARIILERLSD